MILTNPESPPAVEPDVAAIRGAIEQQLGLSPWVELRALHPAGGGSKSRWVGPGDDIGAAAEWAAARNREGLGAYSTFNRIDGRPGGCAKDFDVAGRSLVFVDIDPERAAGNAATEGQRAEAAAVADAVAADLAGRGWGDPLERHDTGNGVALYYLCEPVVGAAAVKALLKALHGRHRTAGAEVDSCVHNSARLSRLPGTANTKGGGRRLCRVLAANPEPVTVTAAMVAMAGTTPKPDRPAGPPPAERRADDIARRVAAHLLECPAAVSGQDGHGRTFAAARAVAWGFDLSEEAALALLIADYNPRCVPPWTEAEMRHKVRDALDKQYDRPRGYLLTSPGGTGVARPEIVIDFEEYVTNLDAARALAADPGLFARGGSLVEVRLDGGTAAISHILKPVRDKLTRYARSVEPKSGACGEPTRVPARPPEWCVGNVAARGDYPGMCGLDGLVGFPVIGPCGRVLGDGYHESARLYVASGGVAVRVPTPRPRPGAC